MVDKTVEKPDWKPLEQLVGPEGCGESMWMWREGGIEFYKHIRTRRYLLLDSAGRCYQRGPNGLQLADAPVELKQVTE